jgi:hypothetical protein
MEAFITLQDPNFEIILSRQIDSNSKMTLSTIRIPIEDIHRMIDTALIDKIN